MLQFYERYKKSCYPQHTFLNCAIIISNMKYYFIKIKTLFYKNLHLKVSKNTKKKCFFFLFIIINNADSSGCVLRPSSLDTDIFSFCLLFFLIYELKLENRRICTFLICHYMKNAPRERGYEGMSQQNHLVQGR